MRIEDITVEILTKAPKEKLYELRLRFIQFYGKNFEKNSIQKIGIIKRSDLLERYRLLLKELHGRGLKVSRETALDRSVFRKAMFGLDIKCLSEKIVIEDYVAISGPFVNSPVDAENVNIVIKEQDNEMESILKEALSNEICKEIDFAHGSESLEKMGIPLYDLVLKPKESLRRIEISKPEVTEQYVRIPIGSECQVTATIDISEEKGIKALYCGKDKRIRTYLFDKEKWTMAEAKKWIAEQAFKSVKKKITKKLHDVLETYEYLIHHIEVDGDKEIIHHCHLYDHIGNLFEQAHLWIDKGKVYLDGKEIKDGYYHVIKGLEPTQEAAWSEEEAIAANIKPKRMITGMTLKQKSKVW